jgi:uncharacterized glyoxalase superfamily protein PhnB
MRRSAEAPGTRWPTSPSKLIMQTSRTSTATSASWSAARQHDQEYGSRDFAVRDLEGNQWNFGTYEPT